MLSYILQTLHDFEREDPKVLDAEAYYRLVLNTRGIAVKRPQNLYNFEFTQHEGNIKKKSSKQDLCIFFVSLFFLALRLQESCRHCHSLPSFHILNNFSPRP